MTGGYDIIMKKLSVVLTILMLSAGTLTACSGGSDTLAQPDKETKSQWGLNIQETSEETEGETEKVGKIENTEESTEETSAVITELEDGIKMLGMKELEIRSVSPVNVRSGPGTDFDKIGGLLDQEVVIMDGICDNEWVHIRFDDKEGYVSMEFVESVDEDTSLDDLLKEAQEVIENGGTIRKETEEETEEETTVKETEKETEKETTAKETEKETKKETTAKETKKDKESSEVSAWATIDVNVRKGPGSNYDSIGVLKQNEGIVVLDDSDPWWWKVEFNGKKAYVSVQYLTTDKPEE